MTDKFYPPLEEVLDDFRPAAIAVSGGVDSMTLAYVAHRVLGRDVQMFHAVSPAVPPAATERVRKYAYKLDWDLTILDAGEFGDERYMQNPANRCFFCKTNLYGTLAAETTSQLLSGTNLDDLGDYRPGLQAAEDQNVRHPFVDAGFTKADVRALAHKHSLFDLAELPSAPCLSSRVETGIRIDADVLRRIDQVEVMMREAYAPDVIRCRVRGDGVVIELDQECLDDLDLPDRAALSEDVRKIFAPVDVKAIAFGIYQRGSTFLTETLK